VINAISALSGSLLTEKVGAFGEAREDEACPFISKANSKAQSVAAAVAGILMQRLRSLLRLSIASGRREFTTFVNWQNV
jgi:hypothetical protein